jgi:hypothetical protein
MTRGRRRRDNHRRAGLQGGGVKGVVDSLINAGVDGGVDNAVVVDEVETIVDAGAQRSSVYVVGCDTPQARFCRVCGWRR